MGDGSSCECDPEHDVATDVMCVLENHNCSYQYEDGSGNRGSCDGVKLHTSIRVEHIKHHVTSGPFGAITNNAPAKHHKCKMVGDPGYASCKCCDCHEEHTTFEGCPCGAKHHFFDQKWQYGTSKYYWVFRPKPNTTTCEVHGTMTRDGTTGVDDGDMFMTGKVTSQDGLLHLEGSWTEPAD